MVSFQALFPNLNQRKMIISDRDRDDDESADQQMIISSNKRKWDDHEFEANDQVDHKSWKNSRVTTTKSLVSDDIGLHLNTPLPSEWQRCLDIQSGEIHFYNTRTQKRTTKDPRGSENSPSIVIVEPSRDDHDSHMSLDLELNLPCHRSSSNNNTNNSSSPTAKPKKMAPPSDHDGLLISLSSVTTTKQTGGGYNFEAVHEEVEMVAAACMKCHMLVMLCKSSPTCPNCKFVHPPYQTPPDIFKPRGLSLSC